MSILDRGVLKPWNMAGRLGIDYASCHAIEGVPLDAADRVPKLQQNELGRFRAGVFPLSGSEGLDLAIGAAGDDELPLLSRAVPPVGARPVTRHVVKTSAPDPPTLAATSVLSRLIRSQ